MINKKLLLGFKSVLICLFAGILLCGCVSEQIAGKEKRVQQDKGKTLDLHIQMALGYVEKGNRESARHHLKKAFELDSDSAAATNAMAMVYQLEGELALAEEQFRLAIKRDKKLTVAHNNYGIFLFNQKRYEEAFTQFELASADLGYVNRSQSLTNLGRTALKLNNKARAQSAFEHACILDRKNSDAYLELADLNLQAQEYANAKKNLDIFVYLSNHTPRSLMLGIQLEKVFGNKDKEASLALILKNNFPYSKEYLEYKQKYMN